MTTKLRTRQEVNNEYTAHAAQYGHKSFEIRRLQGDLRMHEARMEELNKEEVEAPAPEVVQETSIA